MLTVAAAGMGFAAIACWLSINLASPLVSWY